MGYKVTNEVDTFSYRDCYTTEVKCCGNSIVIYVEALIVRSNNSANSNYTNSYAGETRIVFENASISKLIKLGYRKYDAADNLIECVEDSEEPFAAIDMEKFMNKVFLTGIARSSDEDNSYTITIELPDEDPSAITDEYELTIKCSEVCFCWEQYLNRVQDM